MPASIFIVDAFTSRVFGGNPAAVVPLSRWPDDSLLQSIAAENNLSETAFFISAQPGETADFHLRWFTPVMEMDLCGHATLASAHVLWRHLGFDGESMRFASAAGVLRVAREGERLVLGFPSRPGKPIETPAGLHEALGVEPVEVLAARDWLVVLKSEAHVRGLKPDFAALARLDTFAVTATAPGERVDFVSRFFAPRAGVLEDPVTGSAHCTLIPYWSARLGRPELHALQLSARGGELFCRDRGDRVDIGGYAVTYSSGALSSLAAL